MHPKTEQEEKHFLSEVFIHIQKQLELSQQSVKYQANEIQANKEYLYENKDGMDHAEKINVRQSIDNMGLQGELMVAKRKRLFRMLQTPYFGRIDFREKEKGNEAALYVGVHTLTDTNTNKPIIYDWRAPVSSMFYDFELGEAFYESPQGKVEGNIENKRQYRIRNGEMEYLFDSSLTIQDDVLQKELKQASSDKMKNIVATIQREQNKIIRDEDAKALVIQGVAGSGKTSIALHRIAYLLYRFKDTLTSQDILIISPNRVFSHYISNVLPELGEEKVSESSIEAIAWDLFDGKLKFQSFFEQVSKLTDAKDEAFSERISYKSTIDFLKKLDEYYVFLENEGFVGQDVTVRNKLIPAWFFREHFEKFRVVPIVERHNRIVNEAVNNIKKFYSFEVTSKERTDIRNAVIKMFKSYNIKQLYKDFFIWLDKPDLFKMAKSNVYEFSDVFPMLYLKLKIEGSKPYKKVKHLVIDEMQDYSPVQYKVLFKLFSCNKTILGDINQSVNPYSASSLELIQQLIGNASTVLLRTSYRSSYEITQFTKVIKPNLDVIAIERHEEPVTTFAFIRAQDEFKHILDLIERFNQSDYNSLGIITKKQSQSEQIHAFLLQNKISCHLLNPHSELFSSGIIVTTVHMAKGLEFDRVIVPFATDKNYSSEHDRHLLYVACTRAMHSLVLTATENLTSLIKI